MTYVCGSRFGPARRLTDDCGARWESMSRKSVFTSLTEDLDTSSHGSWAWKRGFAPRDDRGLLVLDEPCVLPERLTPGAGGTASALERRPFSGAGFSLGTSFSRVFSLGRGSLLSICDIGREGGNILSDESDVADGIRSLTAADGRTGPSPFAASSFLD